MERFTHSGLIGRRAFLAMAGAGFAATLIPRTARALERSDAIFASCYRNRAGSFGVALLSESGDLLHQYPLPARGHDLVTSPDGQKLAAFARRPGTFAAIFDLGGRKEPQTIACESRRHFYGHGCFSANGQLLYATENDFDNGRGVVGVYDITDDYRRIGEFESFGVGPHDMELADGYETLVIANGGIETHPDYPRAKLNLATMRPNLAVVDASTGDLIARQELPLNLRKLSIRHLAVGVEDKIWFACQNEGDIAEPLPLIGWVSLQTGDITMIEFPQSETAHLRGYVGSIAANAETGHIAITSPRGGVAIEFDAEENRVIRTVKVRDVCGVAASGNSFIFSSGDGFFDRHTLQFGFDNHLALAGV